MTFAFPGMDPYLEHPTIWEGVHSRLVVAISNQLQPQLDPRYIASVEERVFIEGPAQRIPDVWIRRDERGRAVESSSVVSPPTGVFDPAVVVEIDDLEIHQKYLEILDSYNEMKLVTVIELLSPSNKRGSVGEESYRRKQQELLDSDCNFVELDLLRTGTRVLSVPNWKLSSLEAFDYVVCVSRGASRSRFELYPVKLAQRLPRVAIPLAVGDAEVALDLQAAIEEVYEQGRYARRLRYDAPCDPPLPTDQQAWASRLLASSKQSEAVSSKQ